MFQTKVEEEIETHILFQ